MKVAVVTKSHGGPLALLFAALHPERVSSFMVFGLCLVELVIIVGSPLVNSGFDPIKY
jgi:pimeloyl-ACP methyl ester carboxylesterase